MDNEDLYFDSLNKSPAPLEWTKFAETKGVSKVWLVNDSRLKRSYRRIRQQEIYVNNDTSYWKNYQFLGAESPEESILLKFLHELGHVIKQHTGTPGLIVNTSGMSCSENWIKNIPLPKILDDPIEKEAWGFALDIKNRKPKLFNKLFDAYKKKS